MADRYRLKIALSFGSFHSLPLRGASSLRSLEQRVCLSDDILEPTDPSANLSVSRQSDEQTACSALLCDNLQH